MSVTNVLIAGVGGQGIIVAGEALAKAALISGMDVKKSDVHGMAQRGGSVVSHVRFGDKVYSPLIPDGEADFLMATERLEALRWLPFVKKGGKLAVNSQMITPPSVSRGAQQYPEGIIEKLKQFDPEAIVLDCLDLAKQAGDPRTATVLLLGALSTKMKFGDDVWMEALKAAVPAKVIDVNLNAFNLGKEKAIKK